MGRPGATWVETTRDARQSRVWQVSGEGPPIYVKRHRTAGKYRRERDTLPVLASHDLGPALLGHDDALRLLIIAACPGIDPGIDPGAEPRHWRAAGIALRALHRLPCPPDPLPLDDAIRRRLAGWRTRGLLDDAVVAGLAALVERADFGDGRRVLCHRDFAPRNWRVADGRCRLFDLEHAGPDAPEVDLVRLHDEPAFADPRVEAAFYAGYGARPAPDRLRAVLALHALATATWGRRHGDPIYSARGDRLAARLLGGAGAG